MKTVTFPLRLIDDFHKEIKEAAYIGRTSMHEFILKAIRERIEKERIK